MLFSALIITTTDAHSSSRFQAAKSTRGRSPAAIDANRATEVRNAMKHLIDVRRQGLKEQTTLAIESLSRYPYYDVVKLLVDQLEAELGEVKPNTFFLNAYLKSLQTIGNKEFTSAVEKLQWTAEDTLHQKVGNSSTHILPNFDKALAEMRRRSTTLEALPVPKTDNIGEKIEKIAQSNGKVGAMVSAISRVMNDSVQAQIAKNTWIPVIGRNAESDAVLDVMIRVKSKVPLLKGDPGVGKTVIVEDVVKRIIEDDLPSGVYQGELKGAVVIESSPAKISLLAKAFTPGAQSAAVEDFLKGVFEIQKALNRPVLLFLDEAHGLSKDQMNGLKPFLESTNYDVRMILATTGKELGLTLAADEAFMRRIEPILVEEFNEEMAFEILKNTWAPSLSRRYNVAYPDEVIRASIELAPDLRPEVRRPAGPFAVLQDLGIAKHRESGGQPASLAKEDVFRFAAKKMGLPVVPQDRSAFEDYMEKVKVELKEEVIGQDKAVDRIVDRFKASLTSKGKKHSVIMAMGTTGIGKSFAAERLAKRYFGNMNRYLEIDMTQFMEGGYSSNILFGAPNGVISSNTNKGTLCEFFDGKGKGGGIVVLNEIEKAHPDIMKKFMEIFDKGYIQCGDGGQRKVGRSMFIMTSNKGAKKFVPSEWVKTASAEEIARRVDAITQEEMKKAFSEEASYTEKNKTVPPEVLERVDEFLFMRPLDFETAVTIAKRKIEEFSKEHLDLYGTRLDVSPDLAETMLKSSYDASTGARQVNRLVTRYLGGIVSDHYKKFKIESDLKITISGLPNNPTQTVLTAIDRNGHSVEFDGPAVPVANELMDPKVRERVKNLEANVSKQVIGQPEAVQKISKIVKAQAASPNSKTPGSIYLIGMTGTGKTELAKAVARERYGRDDAVAIISMGEVSNAVELNDIFSPPKATSGSDTPGEFERFLETHPDGGVVVWDEMSNAGGNNKSVKNEIAKKFYSLLEEGSWTNPSGKTYDLSKYLFVFTGNDGEELFDGASNDDTLEAIWKDVGQDPVKVREILARSGFPKAFLGRINDVVLMRPTRSSSRVLIAQKLLNQWLAGFKAQPFTVELEPGFIEKFAKLFYTPDQGARSFRNIIKSKLAGLVAEAAIEFDWDTLVNGHEKGKIHVSLKETSILNPFYMLRPDPVEAIFGVEAEYGRNKVYEGSLDVTREARFMTQIPILDAWGTAFHEAGHAILNDPQISGRVLAHLTIIPSGKFLGYARYEDIPNARTNHSRKTVVAEIAHLLAGSIAEELIGHDANTGKAGDLKMVRKLITKAAVEGGLEPKLYGVKVGSDGEPILSPRQSLIFEAFSEKLIEEGDQLARKVIAEKWIALREVAVTLIKTGSINGHQVEEIVQKFNAMTESQKAELMKHHSIEAVKHTLEAAGDKCSNALLKPVMTEENH